jgi:hypothetical protein
MVPAVVRQYRADCPATPRRAGNLQLELFVGKACEQPEGVAAGLFAKANQLAEREIPMRLCEFVVATVHVVDG